VPLQRVLMNSSRLVLDERPVASWPNGPRYNQPLLKLMDRNEEGVMIRTFGEISQIMPQA
jgi:hypothetical protein